MRVEDRALAGVEGDEQPRLVDVVHARLEVVAEAAHAGDVPGEVVAELILLLLSGLRRVHVGASRERRWGTVSFGADERDAMLLPKSAILEDELVQPLAGQHPVVIHVDRVELVALSPQLSGVAEAPAALYGCVFLL